MQIPVHFFGQLTDITGTSVVYFDNPGTLSGLQRELLIRYPALEKKVWVLAINNVLVTGENRIEDTDTLACMPPFSGG